MRKDVSPISLLTSAEGWDGISNADRIGGGSGD